MGDGIKLCEKCGNYTTGRLCRSCAEQESIDREAWLDEPQKAPEVNADINTPEHQQWLEDTTNQLVNRWLDETGGLPITLQLTRLGFAVINGLEAAFKAGFEAGAKKITHDNEP